MKSRESLPLRVAFETLGCRSNQADTIDLQSALVDAGAIPTTFDQPADVYVINSCTVTDDADRTVLRLMRRARGLSPDARVVVTGCMAETGAERIHHLRIASAVIGPGKRREVVRAILGEESPNATPIPAVIEADPRTYDNPVRKRGTRRADPLTADLSASLPGPASSLGDVRLRSRYHLRIQEGCENSCTFCIIPASRGAVISRPIPQILNDIEHLSRLGYQEIVLTGTHLGGYGQDTGTTLAALLSSVSETAREKGGGPRIRLSSIDPNDVSLEIVEILAGSDIFCGHLHICVQAFSDAVLKRMNRRYRLSEVCEIVSWITARIPGCCLGSDVITGFPGESRQEVEQAIEAFLGLPFSYLHVFPYSERAGTAATRLDGQVSTDERRRRAARWRALSEARRSEFHRGLLGRTLEVVLETGDREAHDGWLRGTSREFASVLVDPARRSNTEEWRPGQRVSLRAERYDESKGCLLCA